MDDMLPVLQPLQVVTSLLCSETTPSSSMVYPLIQKLITSSLAHNANDSSIIHNFKADVRRALTQRFELDDAVTPTHPFVVATVLDPAVKGMENFTDHFRQAAYAHVRQLTTMQLRTAQQPTMSGAGAPQPQTDQPAAAVNSAAPSSSTSTAPPSAKKPKLDTRTETLKFLGVGEVAREPAVSEFDRYLSTPVNKDVDVLAWWSDNKELFPAVATVASNYLSLPATSVMSERQFSAAGRLVTKLRTCLDPDRVDTLIFLYKNM